MLRAAAAPTAAIRQKTSVALLVLCQSLQQLVPGALALFLPLIREELHLSFAQAGTVVAASSITYAFMQIPAGYAADRFGAKRVFLIGLLGVNVLVFIFAQLDDFVPLVTNQAVAGFFRSLVFAPGLLLISALFPLNRRATAMGLFVAGGFASSVLMSTIGPIAVGPVGWRAILVTIAGAALVALALYWRFGAPGPRITHADRVPIREVLMLFRHRGMLLVAAIQYVRLAVVSGLAFWLPTYIVVDRGQSLQLAGLVVALSALATAPSNLLGGYLSDRSQRPLLVIGGSLVMLAISIALLPNVGIGLLVAVAAVNGLFVQIYFGPLFAVPIHMLGARWAGVASGYGNFFANLGGFTFVYLLGVLKDATGSFVLGFYSLSALCLVGLVCTFALSRMMPRRSIPA